MTRAMTMMMISSCIPNPNTFIPPSYASHCLCVQADPLVAVQSAPENPDIHSHYNIVAAHLHAPHCLAPYAPAPPSPFHSLVGAVQQLNGVHHLSTQPGAFDPAGELQQAAGIAGGDHIGVDRGDVLHLAVQQTHRHLGLGQIVGAGTSAAPIG